MDILLILACVCVCMFICISSVHECAHSCVYLYIWSSEDSLVHHFSYVHLLFWGSLWLVCNSPSRLVWLTLSLRDPLVSMSWISSLWPHTWFSTQFWGLGLRSFCRTEDTLPVSYSPSPYDIPLLCLCLDWLTKWSQVQNLTLWNPITELHSESFRF
jgi:hypothetical protein